MKLKVIFLWLIFAGMFLSCKKEEQPLDVNSEISLLSKVIIDNQAYYEYLYNNENLISEQKGRFDFTVHNYNDKNQLLYTDYYGNYDILSSDILVAESALNLKEWVTPDNSTKLGTLRYQYNSNEKLIKTTYSRPLSSSSEYSEYSYDINNRISRQNLFWENNKTGYTDYSYDTRGNLIKETLYYVSSAGIPELSTTTIYEFDSEKNPYRSFRRIMTPGINTNINNIVKVTCTIHLGVDQVSDKVLVTNNSYVYNYKGYPISRNSNVVYVYK